MCVVWWFNDQFSAVTSHQRHMLLFSFSVQSSFTPTCKKTHFTIHQHQCNEKFKTNSSQLITKIILSHLKHGKCNSILVYKQMINKLNKVFIQLYILKSCLYIISIKIIFYLRTSVKLILMKKIRFLFSLSFSFIYFQHHCIFEKYI